MDPLSRSAAMWSLGFVPGELKNRGSIQCPILRLIREAVGCKICPFGSVKIFNSRKTPLPIDNGPCTLTPLTRPLYTAVTLSKITTASYPKGNVHLRKFFHEMKMKERCERCFICIGGCVTVSRVPGCRGRERGWTCILIAPPTTLGTPSPALPPLDNFQRPGNICF